MNNTTTTFGVLTIKVGVMPGKIQEVAVEVGTPVAQVLEMVELSAQGYEVRVNGTTSNADAILNESGTVLLVKQIKGNANIKIGIMPGRISEFAVNDGTTVAEALALAELNDSGYEVRLNGSTITDTDTVITMDGTLLLVKQIKGNGNWKIGIMPGKISEFALEEGTSVRDALAMAELDNTGYEIRVNGATSDIGTGLTGDGTVLLVKQIKGNK